MVLIDKTTSKTPSQHRCDTTVAPSKFEINTAAAPS